MITITVNGVDLPPTLSTDEVAEMLGASSDTLYLWARDPGAPLQPLRLGRKLRWVTMDVLRLLRLEDQRR